MTNLISWIMGHQALVAGAVVGILDLVFALVPSWASNGILHFILMQLQAIGKSNPPSAPSAPTSTITPVATPVA
jgi:hypothetical protein